MLRELEAAESSQTSRKWRRRIIPTAAAAIFGLTLLGSAALPASAASTAAATTAHSSAQATPDGWLFVGSYPTKTACREEAVNLGDGDYRCTEITEGDYFVWDLYIYLS